MVRWRIGILLSVAIAISYLDRQTLPVAIKAIQADIPISNQTLAFLNSAFLFAYALMYLGGGKLMDTIGTRRGFALTMLIWSLACASHGLAANVAMLVVSRLLLGLGEGGGFPAATRAIAEWFPSRERSMGMGMVNGGSAIGGMLAPPLISLVLMRTGWFHLAGWRWVFFVTGAIGLIWTIWWLAAYCLPQDHPRISSSERELIAGAPPSAAEPAEAPIEPPANATRTLPYARRLPNDPFALPNAGKITYADLLSHRETFGLLLAKFFSDAAWFFYLFWLPKFLYDAHHFDIKSVGAIAWLPHVAAGIGCLCGGGLSSLLLFRGRSLNFSRKIAMATSALMMPLLILVPHVPVLWAIGIFCVGYFGHQSWSTVVMTLPTDLFPRSAIGTVAGMVGFAGAMGGVVFGQIAGYMLDHHMGYGPVFVIFGTLHPIALALLLVMVPRVGALMAEPATPVGAVM
ncbi:MAG TPA: MFS transporter [Humisphaera sp.]|jgi:ACS family hexuronate transporter-like MFS transporter|nr:MFS transporter [Humisphaera sp.]